MAAEPRRRSTALRDRQAAAAGFAARFAVSCWDWSACGEGGGEAAQRALLDADSQFSVRGTPRDVFLVAEWVRSADGALARCGVDGVATPPLDDAPDTDAIDWGAYPDHWDGMRATAAAAGVAPA
jgi:hypothetical protein